MQTVPLAAAEHSDFLLLISAGEVEARQIGSGVDVAAAHAECLGALTYDFIDGFVGQKVVVVLVDVCDFHCFTDIEGSGVRRLLTHDESEKGCLSGSVGADDADDSVGRQNEVEIVEELFLPKRLCQSMGLDNLISEARAVGDEDLELLFAGFLVFVEKTVIAVESGFSFCLTGFRSHAHPFELAFKSLAAFRRLFLFLSHALGLLVEPARIVSFPWDSLTTVELENPTGHMVEEIAVVGDGDDSAGILVQVLLKPVDRLGVEMVGRFVEKQNVGLLEKKTAESHAAAFTAGEGGDCLIVGRTLERVHGALELAVDIPGVGSVEMVLQFGLTRDKGLHLVGVFEDIGVGKGFVDLVEFGQHVHNGLHSLAHNFNDGFVGIELRILLEIADSVARRENNLALITLVDSGYNLQQSRLPGAVKADNADLGSVEE